MRVQQKSPSATIQDMRNVFIKSLTLVAAAGVSALFSADAAQAASCKAIPGEQYDIRVESEIPKARIDHSKNRAALGIISGDLSGSIQGLHQHGVTLTLEQQIKYYPQGEGICFWLNRVVLTVAYETPVIYVAKEYSERSCNYRAILQHEAKHVQVAQTHIRQYRDRFHKSLSSLNLPRPTEPRYAKDAEAAKADSLDQLRALVMPIFKRLEESMTTTQQKVDLPREYREVQRRCAKW
ncbi:hypothetical protein [Limibacillus sp. MBR-115]|uniref:hypothetical protein n=1 Tax=Limibacillus sp. MBR-115 TaxID=3156465 RepID=UPI0033910890